MILEKKCVRNAHSSNPKKNPLARRHRSTALLPSIPTFALKPKRTALGVVVEGRFVRFWGGRKPSRYTPATENTKHAIKHAA